VGGSQTRHKKLFDRYLSYDQKIAPENIPELFLAICAVVGYGRLIAERKTSGKTRSHMGRTMTG
jgi:hypothetical protein